MTEAQQAEGGVLMRDSLKGLGSKKPFHLRLPASLRSRLQTSADLSKRSLNAHIAVLLESSLRNYPVLHEAQAHSEPLSKSTLGVRLQDELRERIDASAAKSGRSVNSEICCRLLVASGVASANQDVAAAQADGELPRAWNRLSQAIESMLAAGALELSAAADEVKKAKADYEYLLQLKNSEDDQGS